MQFLAGPHATEYVHPLAGQTVFKHVGGRWSLRDTTTGGTRHCCQLSDTNGRSFGAGQKGRPYKLLLWKYQSGSKRESEAIGQF